MSDIGASQFYSAFWDYYIAIITIVSVIGCAVFLWLQGRRTVKAQINAKGDIQTTGHVWDGDLQEFHNPDAALVDLAVLSDGAVFDRLPRAVSRVSAPSGRAC